MELKIMKVKPWGQGQGDHVLINESDFDPSFHVPFDAAEKPAGDGGDASKDPQAMTAAQLKEALTAKGIAFKGNASKADLQALLDATEKPAE